MTPEAQRIAIAEACGWQSPHHPENVAGMVGWWAQARGIWWVTPEGKRVMIRFLPDYLNDLNAMHEAESTKDFHHDQRWIEALVEVGLRATALRLEKTDGWDWALVCARSTASQRAEAFLRTLNLWTDKA